MTEEHGVWLLTFAICYLGATGLTWGVTKGLERLFARRKR